MFNSLKDVDIDYLKKNHDRLYFFGFGFIQLKIDDTYQLHFYNKALLSVNEDVHR